MGADIYEAAAKTECDSMLSPRMVASSCAGASGCFPGAVDLVQDPDRHRQRIGVL